MLEAARFDAKELALHHVVSASAPQAHVLQVAIDLARKLAPKGGPIMRTLKQDLFRGSWVDLQASPVHNALAKL